MAIAANRHPGVRAVNCSDTYTASMSRSHNDSNVLTLGERVVGPGLALAIAEAWLAAPRLDSERSRATTGASGRSSRRERHATRRVPRALGRGISREREDPRRTVATAARLRGRLGACAMKCPFCANGESRVTDTRASVQGDVVRRRRECESCARRFTTYERVEEVLPLVVKKDMRREAFDRQKLLGGLRRACEKRPVSLEALEAMADATERELMDSGEKEITSRALGESVMRRLRTADGVAYVRFASVYRQFRDIDEFRTELETLARDGGPRAAEAPHPDPSAALALAPEATP